ncbi:MAG: pyruvate phosphate dikinase PEP/pyruvate-binding protein, partial [Moorea sp. SIO4A3]|nr:pyruvate phosphate dikinase PEP/pyruvate-binding protein [Moorena sp. SIO4A3]
AEVVQARLDLKGRVTQVYSKLMAHLRWSFLAIEARWLLSGLLLEPGEIFFLELPEIRCLVGSNNQQLRQQLPEIVQQRRTKLAQDAQLTSVPFLVYGNNPPLPAEPKSLAGSEQQLLQGIGASSGLVEGLVKVVKSLQTDITIDQQTIVVVPYTDSGWAPLLARAGGLISEVGGRLSHGAIVAREYGIPAVMDINHATDILRDGQRVRIDGQLGTVEVWE